jgi:fatty acid desaturase
VIAFDRRSAFCVCGRRLLLLRCVRSCFPDAPRRARRSVFAIRGVARDFAIARLAADCVGARPYRALGAGYVGASGAESVPKNFGWRIPLKYFMSLLRMKALAYSKWDAVPALCGFLHFAYVLGFFILFPSLPWWALVCMGIVYSISISWNINGISHNFLHNPYFTWRPLNRVFSLAESLSLGFSQTFYKYVHHRHHMGNSDKPGEDGDTVDWLSIYRHGHDGEAENVWSYVFLSYMRDDPKAIFAEIKRKNPADAYWGVFEIVAFLAFFVLLGVLNWKFIVFFLPFYYLGHCLSYLNGYFLHYGGNPDKPIAWGVSSYEKFYNLLWFNNGYHAEHHFRPKLHWTKMQSLHLQIADQQRREGTRVIKPPHALAFLDPTLPDKSRPLTPETESRATS